MPSSAHAAAQPISTATMGTTIVLVALASQTFGNFVGESHVLRLGDIYKDQDLPFSRVRMNTDGSVDEGSTGSGETEAPTEAPTSAPTLTPTFNPTNTPTFAPTHAPTATPTAAPTATRNFLGNAPTSSPVATPAPTVAIADRVEVRATTQTDQSISSMDEQTQRNLKFALGSTLVQELNNNGANITYDDVVHETLEDSTTRRRQTWSTSTVIYTAQFAESDVSTSQASSTATALTNVAVSYTDSVGATKTATITTSAATALTSAPTPAPKAADDDDDLSDGAIAAIVVCVLVVVVAAAAVAIKMKRSERRPAQKQNPPPYADSAFQHDDRYTLQSKRVSTTSSSIV